MKSREELIQEFERFIQWVETLHAHCDELLFQPIDVGKWTVAEILTHITFWDRYILEETLPKMKEGAKIESIEFEALNTRARKYL